MTFPVLTLLQGLVPHCPLDLSSSSVQLSGDAVFPCSSQVQSGGTDSGSVSMSSPHSCTRPLLVDVVFQSISLKK